MGVDMRKIILSQWYFDWVVAIYDCLVTTNKTIYVIFYDYTSAFRVLISASISGNYQNIHMYEDKGHQPVLPYKQYMFAYIPNLSEMSK